MLRVFLLPVLARFSYGWVVFICVERTFPGRVYRRVSYVSIWLRFFRVDSYFAPWVCLAGLRFGSVYCFFAFRCLLG